MPSDNANECTTPARWAPRQIIESFFMRMKSPNKELREGAVVLSSRPSVFTYPQCVRGQPFGLVPVASVGIP